MLHKVTNIAVKVVAPLAVAGLVYAQLSAKQQQKK